MGKKSLPLVSAAIFWLIGPQYCINSLRSIGQAIGTESAYPGVTLQGPGAVVRVQRDLPLLFPVCGFPWTIITAVNFKTRE